MRFSGSTKLTEVHRISVVNLRRETLTTEKWRGYIRNQDVAPAPEEPNVYRLRGNRRLALQRSARFPTMLRKSGLRFAPLERREIFLSRFYKHRVPTGLGNSLETILPKKLDL